ncbi:La-related protein 1A [Naviculisporaceae sp. PSN 640]
MSTISYAQAAKGAAVQSPAQSAPTSPPTSTTQAKDEVPTANASVMAPSVASSELEGLDVSKNGHADAEITLPRQDLEMAEDSAPSTTSVADQSIKSSPESDTTVESHQQQEEKRPRSTHRNPRTNDGPDGRRGRKGKKGRTNDKEAHGEQQQQDEKEKEKEKVVLSEAPLPAVNIWKERQERRAKQVPVTASAPSTAIVNGTESRKPQAGQEEGDAQAPNGVKDKSTKKVSEQPRNGEHGQRRSAPRGARGNEKDDESSGNLPSVEDTSAWPDPKSAASSEIAGQKPQAKTPTTEREDQKESRQSQKTWRKIDVTPNVIFNTQFSTRGGHRPRGGARGGREAGSSREAQSSTSNTNAQNATNDKPASVNGASSTKGSTTHSRENNGPARPVPQNGAPAAPKRAPVDGPASKEQRKPSVSAQAEPARESGAENAASSSKKGASYRAPHGDIRLTTGELGPSVPKATAHDRPKPFEAGKDGQPAGNTQQHGTREGRSERGRGGYRNRAGHNGANGQHTQQSSYGQNGQYSAPPFQPRQNSAGPSTPHSSQFPSYGQQTRGRGGQHRWNGSTRSNSNGNGASYVPRPPAQLGEMPIQQYVPYAYPQPMPAYDGLFSIMKNQVEYYFSTGNLPGDKFLRERMDGQGFVKLSVIANFPRVTKIIRAAGGQEPGMDLLRSACVASDLVELVVGEDQVDRLRLRENWREFVFPPEARTEELRDDRHINFTPYPKPTAYYPYAAPVVPQHYAVTSPVGMYYPGDAVYQSVYTNGGHFDHNGSVPNGHHYHPGSQLSAGVPDFHPAPAPFTLDALNSISDSAVEGLTVLEEPSSASSGAGAAGYISNNAHQVEANGITSQTGSPSNLDVSNNGEPTPSETPTWFKNEPIETAVKRPYSQVKQAALAQRQQANAGETPEQMRGLYKFWSQLLIQNFNARLYQEFRSLSLEDADQDKLFGLRYLLDFLNNLYNDQVKKPWLQTPIIPEVFQLHLQEANDIHTRKGPVEAENRA